MNIYTNVFDLGNLREAVREALEIKKNRYAYKQLGENKTLLMVFFNSSLWTRLSTQKAGMNLGMNTMVLDINQGVVGDSGAIEALEGIIIDITAHRKFITLWSSQNLPIVTERF